MLCDFGGITGIGSTPVALSVSASNSNQTAIRTSPCYAGIQLKTNNSIVESGATGAYTTIINSPVVIGGTLAEVWAERSITSGALTTDTIGAGRVQCSIGWQLECYDANSTNGSEEECLVVVSFYDASTAGNLLDTATYDLYANYTIV